MADKKKMDIVTKMTVIGIASAAIIIIIASVAAMMMSGGDTGNTPERTTTAEVQETTTATEEETAVKDFARVLAVVKHVDDAKDQLMIYDIENLEMVTLKMNDAIEIKDAYGKEIALAQIDVGDMVESKYDKATLEPEYVKITAVTWERKDVSNMIVDTENKAIKISNDVFSYTDELVTSDNGMPFDIGTIAAADEVSVRGYQDTVWSIVLLNSHGTIRLINYDAFLEGEIEIGNRFSQTISGETVIDVAAGVQNVVVTKEFMTPFVTQVMVEEGKETVIDLGEAQPKVGTVEFILVQEGVTVYIDGVAVDLSEEVVLDFGTYAIKAEKENFVTWESELMMAQAYQQFKIDLEQTPNFVYINEPEGAEAYLDGVLIGVIPTEAPFTAGNHKIQLRQDGYRTSDTYNYLWEDDGLDRYLILPALIPLQGTTDANSGDGTDIESVTGVPDIPGTTSAVQDDVYN